MTQRHPANADMKALGNYARTLREQARKPLRKIAEDMGVSHGTLAKWETASGLCTPNFHDLARWANAICTNDDDRNTMIKLFDPSFDLNAYGKAFNDYVGLMALDDKWLDAAPDPKKHFGMYLQACRNLLNLSQAEAAGSFRVKPSTLGTIESSNSVLAPKAARHIAKVLERNTGLEGIFSRERFNILYERSMPLVRAACNEKNKNARTARLHPQTFDIVATVEQQPEPEIGAFI